MPVKRISLIVACIGLLTATSTVAGQTADATRAFSASPPAAAGRPLAIGRLLVQLEVVPTCTFETDAEGPAAAPIRCTRGVPYRAGVIDDADAAFASTRVFAPALAASGELVRIEAQRLDVEF
jgi:hypothetical protein